MEEKTKVEDSLLSGKRLVIAIALAVIIVLLCSVFGMCAALLSSDKIYPGIYIGELDVGAMTTAEAAEAVRNYYTIDTEMALTLRCGEETRTLAISSLSPTLNPDPMVEAAYRQGRDGSVLSRLRQIRTIKKETVLIPAEAELNEEVLLESIQSIALAVDQPQQDNQFEITENELILTRGHSGKRINEQTAIRAVKQNMMQKGEHTVDFTLETVNPAEITAEYIASQVCGEPQDATYRVENYKLMIENEKIGVSMDMDTADKMISNTNGDIIRIPITTKAPEITAEQLRSSLFSEQLGTYSTRYNAGDRNRSYNIALACKNINEIVLAPGDVFSYNDAVGPRTAARGFRVAHVYVGNKVEDGIGGGICQVSSTLYNAVVLSDLKIVTRANHSLPVSYVPMGRDATVSYGSIDFKFENNTDEPIKIAATASGGQTAISIYGKKVHPNRTIAIEAVRTATYPASLEQKEDPELPEGTIEVEQKGSDGSTYQTYKVIKENGTVVSREPLAKSTYVTANRIERIGTKPIDSSVSATVPTDAVVSTPQPDALPTDNPVAETTPTPMPTADSAIHPTNPAA